MLPYQSIVGFSFIFERQKDFLFENIVTIPLQGTYLFRDEPMLIQMYCKTSDILYLIKYI